MDSEQTRSTPGVAQRRLAIAYGILRDRWRAAEAGAPHAGPSLDAPSGKPPWDRPELVRFLRRLGAIPKSRSGTRAAEIARAAVMRVAEETGSPVEEVGAVLAGLCDPRAPNALCGREPLCTECPLKDHCTYPVRRLTIKDLPRAQRPRERLLEAGEDHLSDVELLAIIIRNGSGKETALDLAARLLSTYGNFRSLADCTAGELTRVNGIGPAKAAQIKAALAIARRYASERLEPGTVVSGSQQLFDYMRQKLRGLKKETFYSLMLDTKHRVIRQEQVAVGSLNESVVHPREVFKSAIRESAARVVFVHNHPSGNPEPSPQDRRLTARLCQAGELVGIQVLDHIIVGDDGYFSFAEHGLLATPAPPPAETEG
jgi:DNA repair protein RadC